MTLEIRMQSRPGEGERCCVPGCRRKQSGYHGLPTYNGDIVSNDWAGDWAGAGCCEPCYKRHEEGKIATADALYLHHLDGFTFADGAGI